MTNAADHPETDVVGETRRDFLVLLAEAIAGVGATIAIWPFISSMNRARDVIAAGAPVEIDIAKVQPGQQITVLWRSRPVFILHRTRAELNMLQQSRDVELLSDPNSTVHQQADYAKNWHRSIKPEYLVVVGICTHLGCIPNFKPEPDSDLGSSWPGGYFCPCHGSRYDLSGRVFKGVPAPYNLPIPPYHFVGDTIIRIGGNPSGSQFKFSSIIQI